MSYAGTSAENFWRPFSLALRPLGRKRAIEAMQMQLGFLTLATAEPAPVAMFMCIYTIVE
jgi:hypothetical protein